MSDSIMCRDTLAVIMSLPMMVCSQWPFAEPSPPASSRPSPVMSLQLKWAFALARTFLEVTSRMEWLREETWAIEFMSTVVRLASW